MACFNQRVNGRAEQRPSIEIKQDYFCDSFRAALAESRNEKLKSAMICFSHSLLRPLSSKPTILLLS